MPLVNEEAGMPEDIRVHPGVLLTPPGQGAEPATSFPHTRPQARRPPHRAARASAVAVVSLSPAGDHRSSETCRGQCEFVGATERHHDRLLAILGDPDRLLELIELAVTWAELDYSSTPVIAPHRWMSFFYGHHWSDPQRAERIFSLATDVAMTAMRAGD